MFWWVARRRAGISRRQSSHSASSSLSALRTSQSPHERGRQNACLPRSEWKPSWVSTRSGRGHRKISRQSGCWSRCIFRKNYLLHHQLNWELGRIESTEPRLGITHKLILSGPHLDHAYLTCLWNLPFQACCCRLCKMVICVTDFNHVSFGYSYFENSWLRSPLLLKMTSTD